MMKSLAVVTGASSGIGAATARRLHSDGWSVLLVGRNRSRLEAVAKEVRSDLIVSGDLRDPKTTEVIATMTKAAPTPLRLLVNNAGLIHRRQFSDLSDSNWVEEFEVNLLAPVRLIRTLVSQFDPQQSSIVNVASTLGLRPIAQTASYSASKAALINLTHCLALELAPKIRVNCVCPGLVDTPIHAFNQGTGDPNSKTKAHQAQPMGRMGTADEIAAAIAFLASSQSAWTTGSILTVDGGIVL